MGKLSIALSVVASAVAMSAQAHPLKAASDQYVADTVAWIQSENIQCAGEAPHAMCETSVVKFSDGAFDQNRTDPRQTILVLDSAMDLHTVLRYRSRIKAHLEFDPQTNTFVEGDPEVAISKLGKKLLTELDTFKDPETQGPAFLASAWLRNLAVAYGSAAPGDTKDHITQQPHFSHGSKVLGYLTQHNPNAEFVVIDTATFLPYLQHQEAVCNKDSQTFKSYMQTAADSLTQDVIEQYGVEYINFSGGYNRYHVKQAWQRNECSGNLSNYAASNMLLAMKPYYDAMFEAPGVLGFQAAVINADNKDDALDVIDYPNRIRVQPYTSENVDTDVSPTGESGWQKVFKDFSNEFSGHDHIDMYVNFGYGRTNFFNQNSTPKMTSDVFGMQYAADWALLSSSWSTPVAVSYAIHEQAKLYDETFQVGFAPALLKDQILPKTCNDADGYWYVYGISAFMWKGDYMCRIQDPLKYRADQLNTLGYLAL
ncbi:hypothetical protein L1077_05160 [Pseudoalteromonas luteoviolacea]|uniref:hypothetical protein n=1 Tax=Pseudoalteromonas luteoviolacea TaxID=43657 RepID=UPI001F19C91C|nr:hypothetical protein [Pseudoalteromonas luteoviolacea]MCF6438818.1 hypothetical protein [Pseudoalteromonas luteoviolacea]